MRKILIVIVGLIVAGIAVAFLTPWNAVIGNQITQALTRQGFSDVRLHVTGWNWRGIMLEDLSFGAEAPLSFKNVRADYSLDSLRAGRIEGLSVTGSSILVKQVDDKWLIEGMEHVFKPRTDAAPLSVTSLTQDLQALPFDKLNVTEGTITISGPDGDVSAPLNIGYSNQERNAEYQGRSITLRKGNITAIAETLSAQMTLNADQHWQGTWTVDSVNVEGAAAPVPPLSGGGTIMAAGSDVKLEGQLQSADKAYLISFRYNHSFDDAKPSTLHIVNAVMPWKEGRLKIANAEIPVGAKRDLNISVQAENISVGELLGAMTGQRVHATGTISGTVPVTLKTNGDMVFHQGGLAAVAPGTISMPPDAIPGDNQQIELVRNILSDLRYTNLSMTLDSSQQNDLGILMTVEGHNPAVYNGRAVKLNVNLTGDVLDFIRQNVMLLTRPEALWEQDNGRETKP